jgi:hypothetical protein
MANAAATAKKAAEKKVAGKKAAEKKGDDTPPVEETKPKRVVKRTSARVTLTQTKTIEAQFDTTSKKVDELDKKLVEVIKGYEDKPEHSVPVKAQAARDKLAEAAAAIVEGKEAFEEIGEALREFFA